MKRFILLLTVSIFTFYSCSSDDDSSDNGSGMLNLEIGDYYEGGYIAHIFITNEPGYVDGETHGIIAAPEDVGSFIWSGRSALIGTSTILGSGEHNTFLIRDSFWSPSEQTAAWVVSDSELNGFDDWFLPSRAEIQKLYQNLHLKGIVDFSPEAYWSSSEETSSIAYAHRFSNGGGFYPRDKDFVLAVRGIRYF